ncbi:MAG: hypothetical protein WAT20_11050 [Ferruginibacter sp.]|nr:hypothetical protein [Chitinophagaceae bacterium]
MIRYTMYMVILLVLVGGYLFLRKVIDRRVEKITDTEVIRENEEYLGTWASKSDSGFIMFRLHRDGKLTYRLVQYPGTDTTTIHGKYVFVGAGGANDPAYFPRLYTFTENGDTLFNYYMRYLTKYDMTIDKIDKMILSPNNVFDTMGFTFFRIKQ